MYRKPSTKRGEKKRKFLISQSAKVMAKLGYHGTSVANICREAKVANGSFYQYFKSKDEVFSAVVDSAANHVLDAIHGCTNLFDLNRSLFQCFSKHGEFFQVFRETEFLREPAESLSFYEPIIEQICQLLSIQEEHAWAYLGALTFVALNYSIWERRGVPSAIQKAFNTISLQGISPQNSDIWSDAHVPKVQEHIPVLEELTKAQKTRKRILDASRFLFAEKGFAPTKVSAIADRAEVASGTFYVHFDSKEAILGELVSDIGDLFTQGVLLYRSGKALSRLHIERLNLLAFLHVLDNNKDVYRIVREAEFAVPSIGRGYYRTICQRYARGLQESVDNGELVNVSAEIMAWVIMGVAHTTGMRWLLWEPENVLPNEKISQALRWLFNGVSGVAPV